MEFLKILTTKSEPTSKRVPVRLRNSIQKASAAKQRKNKKLAKKVQQMHDHEELVLNIVGSHMAVQDKEGPGNSQPFPIQR
jgi:hypothetical protein